MDLLTPHAAPATGQEITLRTIAMPEDTNPAGDIFGGWLLSQMDLAAFARSSEFCGHRTVTAAVREMTFRKPVKVGDTVLIHTAILKTGRTSMTLQVEAWRRHRQTPPEKVTEGVFIMVAVDDEGHPRPLSLPADLPA
ncbi:acyl-CoA thioesterase [Falsigemmobacter faecalis]|uniref:Acyl-CoA thioesterase n=1 Tax=Falsigemmobacter faecalis TaxID=2488730 RepID=A0A3P3DG35_9RHOB|nr:acyl-CoA thioesterase [Falsigemmobacter faecalis]RRH73225.1 acyl-CoA thioesterase [Falsigemmobacter faecalis]